MKASWAKPVDVIGITVMPCSSMMNGYSLDAVVKEGHAERGLAAAGGTAQQCRPALRQSTLGDFIEAMNADRRLAIARQFATR